MLVKQLFQTILIILIVYVGLLAINWDLLSEERITWDDYQRFTDKLYGPDEKVTNQQPASKAATSFTKNSGNIGLTDHKKPKIDTKVDKIADVIAPEPIERSTQGVMLKLDAMVELVEFNNENAIQNLWQKFQNNQSLHDRQDWSDSSLRVYVYYHDMSSDYSEGMVAIGYESSDGEVHVATGKQTFYSVDKKQLRVSDDAWTDSYPNGSILEEFMVDISGRYQIVKASVIQPEAMEVR